MTNWQQINNLFEEDIMKGLRGTGRIAFRELINKAKDQTATIVVKFKSSIETVGLHFAHNDDRNKPLLCAGKDCPICAEGKLKLQHRFFCLVALLNDELPRYVLLQLDSSCAMAIGKFIGAMDDENKDVIGLELKLTGKRVRTAKYCANPIDYMVSPIADGDINQEFANTSVELRSSYLLSHTFAPFLDKTRLIGFDEMLAEFAAGSQKRSTDANTSPTHSQHIANTKAAHSQHIASTKASQGEHIANTKPAHSQHIASTPRRLEDIEARNFGSEEEIEVKEDVPAAQAPPSRALLQSSSNEEEWTDEQLVNSDINWNQLDKDIKGGFQVL